MVFDLYESSIRGGEESELAATKIINCINKKFLLLKLITSKKTSSEFITSFEMADLFDHLPIDNLKQATEVLSEGLLKATKNVVIVLGHSSSINFNSSEIDQFYTL